MKWRLVVGVLVVLPAVGWALYDHWIDHYRSATGSLCCGVSDCLAVQARLVADRGES